MLRHSIWFILSVISYACVEHSVTDPRHFHCEILSNGLNVLIVEDPNATESAAAMLVNVGSTEDPQGREGLAHFLEHMLFTGTDEHPEVDALFDYVEAHGGYTNAATSSDWTRYYFTVKPEYFKEGLNIFTSFFIAPTFEEAYVDRERQAVNSEFIVSKEDDGWREYHLVKTVSSDHPANRFTTGNLDTLRIEGLRDDLIAFYNSYYSSDRMYFVAVVPKDSQKIMPYIRDRLSTIKKQETKALTKTARYIKDDLGRYIQFKTIKDVNQLSIGFILPNGKHQYWKPSEAYIARLIGDEGAGSIIHALREVDLATELRVGYTAMSEVEDVFEIDITLTEKGVKSQDKVISAVMSYIQLIREDGVSLSRFNEMQRVSFLHYLFYNQQSAETQALSLLMNMRNYPQGKWNNVNYILEDSEFDSSHIQLLLSRMQLDNAIVTFASQSAQVDSNEPIYDIDYSVQDISKSQYQDWNAASNLKLALPQANEFIPDTIEVMNIEDTSSPIQVSEESWYKHGEFNQPKQFIGYAKVLPVQSAQDQAHNTVVKKIIRAGEMRSLYPAILAGGGINIGYDHQGINIQVGGMGDKQPFVLSQVVKSLYALEKVSELQFEQSKDELIKDLSNIEKEKSARILLYQLNLELSQGRYHYSKILEKLKKLSIVDFKKSLRSFLSQSKSQCFYYGNLDIDSVKRLSESIDVDYQPKQVPYGDKVIPVESLRSDDAVIIYHQTNGNEDKDHLYAAIIAQIVRPQMFKQLRTEEQMGYFVSALYQQYNRWPGIAYIVQSPNISTKDIKARIESFLHEVDFLDEKGFESLKSSMMLDLDKPFQTMGEEFEFYWNQIHSGEFDYDKKQRMKSILEDITLEEVKNYYDQLLGKPRQLTLVTN